MNSGPEQRFWQQANVTDGCWLWAGSLNPDGYGKIMVAGVRLLAHRFAYELLVGPIPVGLTIDHLCRVRHCVNPAHMEPVTKRTNTLRGVGISARNARKTHCKNGHEFTPENTYMDSRGRRCRACRRASHSKT